MMQIHLPSGFISLRIHDACKKIIKQKLTNTQTLFSQPRFASVFNPHKMMHYVHYVKNTSQHSVFWNKDQQEGHMRDTWRACEDPMKL